MPKQTVILFVLFLTFLTTSGCKKNGNYETSKWDNTPVLDNENLVSLFFRNEDEFFVARNRLFKTVDGGDTFTELGVGEIDYMAAITGIHFKNDEEGVIIKAGRVFKTFDSGISWEPTYTEFGYAKQLKVFGDVLYIIGGITYHNRSIAEIHKSTDYGESWEKVELDESIRGHEIVPSDFLDDERGYIVTFDNKLYRTQDSAESWTLVNELPFDFIVSDNKVAVTENSGMYFGDR